MPHRGKSSLPILFISAISLLTIFALSVAYWIFIDVKQERIKDLHYTSSVLDRYFELSFKQWQNTLLNLGRRQIELAGDVNDSLRYALAKEADDSYPELLAIGLVDTTGQITVFTGSHFGDNLPNLMDSPDSKRSFLLAKQSDKLTIGEAYFFPSVSDWILPLRMPIRDPKGRLLALNTTAFEYKNLSKDLRSFGFDSNYRIHLVHKDFSTNQYYFPLGLERYGEILRKTAAIYTGLSDYQYENVSYQMGVNSFEGNHSLLVRADLEDFNHELIVSVNTAVIWNDVKYNLLAIGGIYTGLLLLFGFTFRYFSRKEKSYTEAIVEREANLQSIFESTSNIIGLFDRKKNLLEFNQAFSEYARFTDGIELKKGSDVWSKMRPEVAEMFKAFQNRALQGEKFKETVEYPSPDGTIYLLFSYNPIYKNGSISGLSMFVEDITELKKSQKELEIYAEKLEDLVKERTKELEFKNQELKKGNKKLEKTLIELQETQQQLIQTEKMASLGLLAAGIGHEINNPLNFIKNGVSALTTELKKGKSDDESLQPYLKVIDEGIVRASKIVKSLSHFSRQVKTMDEVVDIHEVIENCLIILQNKLKNKVEIVRAYEGQKLCIEGNEGKLHQALLNIITNAEQAIKDKGAITISTSRVDERKVNISIKDNGVGIDKSHFKNIGNPFFTTKDPGVGTGLGLFITYSIIQEHKGTINFHSNKNKGTEFVISLPLYYE